MLNLSLIRLKRNELSGLDVVGLVGGRVVVGGTVGLGVVLTAAAGPSPGSHKPNLRRIRDPKILELLHLSVGSVVPGSGSRTRILLDISWFTELGVVGRREDSASLKESAGVFALEAAASF